MATRYICDRCDHSTSNPENIKRVNIPHYDFACEWDLGADLCSSCIENLYKNMKPMDKAMEKEVK